MANERTLKRASGGAVSNEEQRLMQESLSRALDATTDTRAQDQASNVPGAGAVTNREQEILRETLMDRDTDKAYNQFYETAPVEEKGTSPVRKRSGGEVKGKDWHGFGKTKTGKHNHGF